MDGFSRSGEACPPQLLDLVSKDRNWFLSSHSHRYGGSSEENELELTLGPPGENWSGLKQHQHNKNTCNEGHHETLLSLGHGTMKAQKMSLLDDQSGATKPWSSSAMFLQFPSNAATQDSPVVGKESLQRCNSTSQSRKRTAPAPAPAPAPVVGWPPVRSFRKNLASTSTKPPPESEDAVIHEKVSKHGERGTEKGLFVKMNMDGIPIGRKVDLNAYDSYEKLSSAADKLFRGLLAVQTDSFPTNITEEEEEQKPISAEYTLVYENKEGERVVVGDVPWCIFVSTVKRLRVLKTCDLPSLSRQSPHHLISVQQ